MIKQVVGYEGLYEVDEEGHVFRLPQRGRERFCLKPWKLWSMKKFFYMALDLYKDGVRETQMVHRIVAKAFVENPHDHKEVNHKDEIKTNNRADNLEWCSRQYNVEYSKSKHYKFVDKYGVVHEIFNLRKFCRDNNLKTPNMYSVVTGNRNSHLGWRLYKEDV